MMKQNRSQPLKYKNNLKLTEDEDQQLQLQQYPVQQHKYFYFSTIIGFGILLWILSSLIFYYGTFYIYQNLSNNQNHRRSYSQQQKQIIIKNSKEKYQQCLNYTFPQNFGCIQQINQQYGPILQQKRSICQQKNVLMDNCQQVIKKSKQNCIKFKQSKKQIIKNTINQCTTKRNRLNIQQQRMTGELKKWYPLEFTQKQLSAKGKPYFPTYQDLAILKPQEDFIVVTPAGRREYLQILYKHLLKQKDQFFEWHLWIRTSDTNDLNYIKQLLHNHTWIKTAYITNKNFHEFVGFYSTDNRKKTLYIKIDDDTLWIDPNFLKTMFQSRFKLIDHLIVFSNIINSAIHTHVQKRLGVFKYPDTIEYDCIGNGWYDPRIGSQLHLQFIKDIQNNNFQKWKAFKQWAAIQYERISINAFLYYSETAKTVAKSQIRGDQILFSALYTKLYSMPSTIIGDALSVHGAFYCQREHMNVLHPQILKKYQKFVERF